MKFTRRDSAIFFTSSLIVGFFTDMLVRQQIFGLNFLIGTLLWIAIMGIVSNLKKRFSPRFAVFAGFAAINAALVYVRVEPLVQFWSTVIALISLLLMTGMLFTEDFLKLTIFGRIGEYLNNITRSVVTDSRNMLNALKGESKREKPVQISSGIVIAVILALIFIGLFSGSDAIFRDQFSFIGDLFRNIGDWLGQYNIGRVITVLFWVCVSGGALLAMVGRDTAAVPTPKEPRKFLSKRDPEIILGTLCVIFGIFILIQIRYLFAGGTLPDNLTYAGYARRGYGELLLATMLASGVIYGSLAFARDAARSKARAVLSNSLVVLNGIVVLSAWKRLSLYEGAYGWTMTRFIARLGLICILLGSIWLLLWVNRRLTSKQLFGFSWYSIASVLTLAALLNPIGIIVQKNISERSSREVPIDFAYMNGQSADSYAAVCKYAPSLQDSYPDEYKSLLSVVSTGAPYNRSRANHGLSAHYTFSEDFKRSYECLKDYPSSIDLLQ